MTRTIRHMPEKTRDSNNTEVNSVPTINVTALNDRTVYVVGRTGLLEGPRSTQAYFCGPDRQDRLRGYVNKYSGDEAKQIVSIRQTDISAEATLSKEELKKLLGLNGHLNNSE